MGDLGTFEARDLAIRADVKARQIELRLFTWDEPGETAEGPELIERGALAGIDPASLVLRMDHLDPPIGRGIALAERDDGPYATFQAAATARADEGLQLAAEGVYTGASVGFTQAPPDEYRTINGRRTGIRRKLDVREASLTWRPVHTGSAIIAIRSEQEREPTVTEPTNQGAEAPATAPPAEGAIVNLLTRLDERMAAIEERARRELIDVPGAPRPVEAMGIMGRWVKAALSQLDGDRVPEMELRALDDVTTTDNLGVVPKNIRSELIGLFNPNRPFLKSTRKVEAGNSGMTQTFPRITQRPLVGVQATEKAELASQNTIIGTVDFGVTTIGGAGDLSIQLLKRSSPAFLQLWFQALAEQYAIVSDDKAVDALLAAGVQAGTGVFDPETFLFGESFTNASEVSIGMQLKPDRMWLSTAAFVAMMDARTPTGGGGTPMFPGLVQLAGITRNEGSGPIPISLTPVHVPALDDEAVDVIVGPSRGFAWAEDGTYQLQADVPAKAGRDVGLVGMIWYMPVYPAAFTTYALAP